MQNSDINMCERFDDDRSRNDRALGNGKFDNNKNPKKKNNNNNNNNNFRGHWDPLPGPKIRDGKWMGIMVTDVCAKSTYDRLRIDRALGFRKYDNNKKDKKKSQREGEIHVKAHTVSTAYLLNETCPLIVSVPGLLPAIVTSDFFPLFSPPNLNGSWVDRHQTVPHVRRHPGL